MDTEKDLQLVSHGCLTKQEFKKHKLQKWWRRRKSVVWKVILRTFELFQPQFEKCALHNKKNDILIAFYGFEIETKELKYAANLVDKKTEMGWKNDKL